jgi:DNA-binding MurR/RpiR family transcriptional regulator
MSEKEENFSSTTPQVLPTIRAKLSEMTPVQQKIARFILKNPDQAFKLSMSELSAKNGIKSESTLVRFYRLLGFSSYHDFKVTLATEIAGKSLYHAYEDIVEHDSVGAVRDKVFRGAIRGLQENLSYQDQDTLTAAVEALNGAKRIVCLGYAASAAIAADAFFKFTVIGLNCVFTTDSHVNAVLLSEPQEGDVLFCVSHTGESKDVVMHAENATSRATVIALTGFADSPLGKAADIRLITHVEEMNYRTDAIVSRIVQSTIIGTLFTALCIRRGMDGIERLKAARQSLSPLKY